MSDSLTPSTADLPPGVTLEEPPCPLCGSAARRTLLITPDLLLGRSGTFGIVRCTACGLAYSSPRPTTASLGYYYENAYSGTAADGMRQAQTEGGAVWLQHARWGQLRLHLRLQPEDRLLDVGCGYGAFLRLIRQQTGCRVSGVDLDGGSLQGTVCPEAELQRATLEQAAFPDNHFAAVTLFHSLEHMPDPVATLREVHRILRPGGILFLEVPNFGGLLRRIFGRYWFPLLMPQHLLHFDLASIRRALIQGGFRRLCNLRPCWAPGELTFSLGVWLYRRHPRPAAEAGAQPPTPRLVHLLLTLLFLLVDLPLSTALRFSWLSGHLLAVVRKEG